MTKKSFKKIWQIGVEADRELIPGDMLGKGKPSLATAAGAGAIVARPNKLLQLRKKYQGPGGGLAKESGKKGGGHGQQEGGGETSAAAEGAAHAGEHHSMQMHFPGFLVVLRLLKHHFENGEIQWLVEE